MLLACTEASAPKLGGYAAVFDSISEDMGDGPGCFTATLATDPDIRALINHDANLILGRTKSGTLTLAEDEIGLRF